MKKQMYLLFSVAFVVVTTANGHALMTNREVSSNSKSHVRNIAIKVNGASSILVATSGQSLSDRRSELGYVNRNGSYYKFHDEGADWFRAKDICDSEGAHLVVIDDEAEAQVVADLFSQHPANNKPNGFRNTMFIGVNDLKVEGEYVTVLGDRVPLNGYMVWTPNNPDNIKTYSSDGENCVEMNEDKRMNDIHCTAVLRFVCEVNP